MDNTTQKHSAIENEYLYAVLNLSKYASQTEINERHRSLSLIFHPDKQTDENLKAVAIKEFLEIQKAYQVLSDPFLRQIYDTLGSAGLDVKWPPTLRTQSKQQITDVLDQYSNHLTRRRQNQILNPKGKVSYSIDASALFAPVFKSSSAGFVARIKERVKATRTLSSALTYTVEKHVSDATSISLTGLTSQNSSKGGLHFLGSIRHQFSPRIAFLTQLNFLHPYSTKLEVNYEDPDNELNVKTAITPLAPALLPPIILTYSRRLFRSSPKRGKIHLKTGHKPSLSFLYISPPTLKLPKEEESFLQLGPPTVLGLKYLAFENALGLVFDEIIPMVVAETSVTLVELSTRFKAALHFGLAGLIVTLGLHWSGENTEAGMSLIIHSSALLLEIDFSHLQQQLSLPIVLSNENNPLFTLGTVVIPSIATLIAYRFVVIPRRRARRQAHIQAAKKNFEEDSDSRRERNAVEHLLKDAVKKQIRHETEREGLIIQEAFYCSAETDLGESAKDSLSLNVTVPLQALVHNSQLHISGGNTKAALQGFSDPAPFASKVLRIRYLFRGRMHYCEIPDYLPVVLPLSEHLVNG